MEDQTGQLAAALVKAQAVFEVPKKTKEGQQGNRKFKYAPLEEIIRATRPGLAANSLSIISYLETQEGVLSITSELRMAGGFEMVASRYPLTPGLMTQDRGKEITYGRRYNRCALLDVVGEDNDADDGMEHDSAVAEARKRMDEAAAAGRLKSAYDGHTLKPEEVTRNDERGTMNDTKTPIPTAPTTSKMPSAASLAAVLTPKVTDHPPHPSPVPVIDPLLDQLLKRDGVSIKQFMAWGVAKGNFPAGMQPEKLRAEFLAKVMLTDNWVKVVKSIKEAKS